MPGSRVTQKHKCTHTFNNHQGNKRTTLAPNKLVLQALGFMHCFFLLGFKLYYLCLQLLKMLFTGLHKASIRTQQQLDLARRTVPASELAARFHDFDWRAAHSAHSRLPCALLPGRCARCQQAPSSRRQASCWGQRSGCRCLGNYRPCGPNWQTSSDFRLTWETTPLLVGRIVT